jgi:hypothetical protein
MSVRQQGSGGEFVRRSGGAYSSVERLEGRRLLSARLIGISGNQFQPKDPRDEVLYDINPDTAALTQIVKLSFVPDTDAIGYNPENGLLYRTSGNQSFREDPAHNGYRDNHFMQTIDLRIPAMPQVGVFNANFPGNAAWGAFGLDAPFPNWVLPDHRRTDAETDSTVTQAHGPNEYHAARDLTWSSDEHLFYLADEDGIYKMTADGQSTFFGEPGGLAGGAKAFAFFGVGRERRLLLAERDGPRLFTLDPAEGGQPTGFVTLTDSVTGLPIIGMISVAEHPDGTTLYGIKKTRDDNQQAFTRELVRIDPNSGVTTTVGGLSGIHIADLAFVSRATSEVFGRRVFYNNSVSDGNTAGADPRDDRAIDTTKSGGAAAGAGPASVTGYVKGLNGVMVDVLQLPSATTTLSPSDFTIRAAPGTAPNAWAAGPAPLSVSVRRAVGPAGADRITLIWNDFDPVANPANEAVGFGWLEVTVKANANTGLAAPVTFVFGNLPGDVNGDRAVNGSDFAILAGNFGKNGIGSGGGDFNADNTVNGSDFAILAGNFGKTLAAPPPALIASLAAPQQPAKPAARLAAAAQPRKLKRAGTVFSISSRGIVAHRARA